MTVADKVVDWLSIDVVVELRQPSTALRTAPNSAGVDKENEAERAGTKMYGCARPVFGTVDTASLTVGTLAIVTEWGRRGTEPMANYWQGA